MMGKREREGRMFILRFRFAFLYAHVQVSEIPICNVCVRFTGYLYPDLILSHQDQVRESLKNLPIPPFPPSFPLKGIPLPPKPSPQTKTPPPKNPQPPHPSPPPPNSSQTSYAPHPLQDKTSDPRLRRTL